MKKICFFLFIQASLVGFLFLYHSDLNNKFMNECWSIFLDSELTHQRDRNRINRLNLYGAKVIPKIVLDTTEDIYRIKEEINLVLKEINNAHLIDDIYNRIDVISEFLNSIKGQHYGSRFCIQVYEIPSDLIAESHSKKELEIKMLRTLNDMKFKELGIQNIFVYR